MDRQKTLIVITGPTASGKSALAIELARRLSTEIISADSRQIYRGIPIVTAQPSAEELAAVKHHLVGHLPLDAYYSAALFERDAMAAAEEIFRRSGIAVACGGSMMYVDALCDGIDMLPTVPDSLRCGLKVLHSKRGDEWLLSRLKLVDPAYHRVVDRSNVKRVFHAVEVSLAAGRPYSSLLTGRKCQRPFRIVKFAIDMPREELFRRINMRVLAMVDAGLESEARAVSHLSHLNSLNTVGLKEMFGYFRGEMDFDTAVARIQKNTRVFAKKQLTWLKRDDDVIHVDAHEDVAGLADEVMERAGIV